MADADEVLVPDFPDFEPVIACRAWNLVFQTEAEPSEAPPPQLTLDSVALPTSKLRLASYNHNGNWVPGEVMRAVCGGEGKQGKISTTGQNIVWFQNNFTSSWSRSWIVYEGEVANATGQMILDWSNPDDPKPSRTYTAHYRPLFSGTAPTATGTITGTTNNLPSSDTGEHKAPKVDCACGIYARKTFDQLETTYRGMTIIGTIKLWGDIVQGKVGYRAEFGYPDKLYIMSERFTEDVKNSLAANIEGEATLDNLALSLVESYKVPVEIVKDIDELRERINKYAGWAES